MKNVKHIGIVGKGKQFRDSIVFELRIYSDNV